MASDDGEVRETAVVMFLWKSTPVWQYWLDEAWPEKRRIKSVAEVDRAQMIGFFEGGVADSIDGDGSSSNMSDVVVHLEAPENGLGGEIWATMVD